MAVVPKEGHNRRTWSFKKNSLLKKYFAKNQQRHGTERKGK
jgi:hypothetical protein